MRKELIFRMENTYRDALNIYGYHFGIGEKSTCIVGALRGNEVQQMYICSQLVRALRDLEKHGNLVANNEILVIPSVNHSAMNIGKRFWPVDALRAEILCVAVGYPPVFWLIYRFAGPWMSEGASPVAIAVQMIVVLAACLFIFVPIVWMAKKYE